MKVATYIYIVWDNVYKRSRELCVTSLWPKISLSKKSFRAHFKIIYGHCPVLTDTSVIPIQKTLPSEKLFCLVVHFIYATGWAGLGKCGKPSIGLGKVRELHPTQKEPCCRAPTQPLSGFTVCVLEELKLEVESREVQMLRSNVICERAGKRWGVSSLRAYSN